MYKALHIHAQNGMMCWFVEQSENFQRDLFIMERVVNLNTYQPKQALYRDFPIIPGRMKISVGVEGDRIG